MSIVLSPPINSEPSNSAPSKLAKSPDILENNSPAFELMEESFALKCFESRKLGIVISRSQIFSNVNDIEDRLEPEFSDRSSDGRFHKVDRTRPTYSVGSESLHLYEIILSPYLKSALQWSEISRKFVDGLAYSATVSKADKLMPGALAAGSQLLLLPHFETSYKKREGDDFFEFGQMISVYYKTLIDLSNIFPYLLIDTTTPQSRQMCLQDETRAILIARGEYDTTINKVERIGKALALQTQLEKPIKLHTETSPNPMMASSLQARHGTASTIDNVSGEKTIPDNLRSSSNKSQPPSPLSQASFGQMGDREPNLEKLKMPSREEVQKLVDSGALLHSALDCYPS